MRTLINYLRSCFCKHEWEKLDEARVWNTDSPYARYPIGNKWTYRCKKCCYCKVCKNY